MRLHDTKVRRCSSRLSHLPPSSAVGRLAERVGEVVGAEVELERPKDPAYGDFSTNVAMRSAKSIGRSPREVAEELAAKVISLDEVESAEVAGPGFLNLRVSDAFFLAALSEIGDGYGGGWVESPERVQVEMVSANPTGPVVVSAARNGAYGDCVARLLAFGGHEVSREYYYNDAGNQMERFRASVDALRRGDPVPEDGYHGDYVVDLAREEGDPVARMLASIEQTMERFRIHFDSWALQSELEARLPDFLPRLETYEKDGAVWARSSAFGDDQDWVLIRSADKGGTPTYRAADVVYLVDKLERGYDRAIYVLGADHHATAKWYAAIARMLGYDETRVEVLLYQFVHLITKGGAASKASKRAGNVVFLDELMDEVGVDAARWYLVNRGPDQTIEIDLDLAAEKSAKNPVYYVQYAHARIAAILRNADGAEVGGAPPGPLAPAEKELIKRLTDFPQTVREAADRRGPQLLPAYAIRLADDYHRFYQACRVLGDPAQAFRLGLCRAAQQVVARCLDLVGVEAPDRM
jgi:arginyl-tRNA synthetase